MLKFQINHNASAPLNDAFILILPQDPGHQVSEQAEIFDQEGQHFLGWATVKAKSSIYFHQISDTLALASIGQPAPYLKQSLANAFSMNEKSVVDILAIEWQERNVDAFVAMQAIQFENLLARHKQPSEAMLARLQS